MGIMSYFLVWLENLDSQWAFNNYHICYYTSSYVIMNDFFLPLLKELICNMQNDIPRKDNKCTKTAKNNKAEVWGKCEISIKLYFLKHPKEESEEWK